MSVQAALLCVTNTGRNIHDFAHLSRTNVAPMVEELSSIEADISIREKEIQALREAVEKLQSALDILKPRLEAATDALFRQKSILHPIRRVPAEILQLLFSACMTVWQSEPTSIRWYHTGPLASFPWNLSYVCQRWRRTSIESPDLWSTIEVLGSGSHDRPVERALQLMLDRSASSPLYITLNCAEIAVQHDLLAIVERIIPHSDRWSSLDLRVTDEQLDLFKYIRGNIGSLMELGFQLSNPSVDDVDATGAATVSVFALAPSLRSVRIIHDETYGSERTYRKLKLPWETITDYSAESPELAQGVMQLEVLPLCVNLTRAHLQNINSDAIDEITEDNVLLPKLLELHLVAREPDVVGALLEKLTLPALISLSIDPMDGWGDNDHSALIPLIERSQFSLQTLDLKESMGETTLSSIITFLSSATTISHLSVDDECIELLSQVTPDILPQLTHLQVTTKSDQGFRQSAVQIALDMVESRFPGAFEHVSLDAPSAPAEEADFPLELARIVLLREAGLSVEVWWEG